MKLSLCIATFNEESNIHYALDSAYNLADEVIIVDGGSTDKTVEIAKSYGNKVKIIHTDNPPMFHINKQKALDAAKGEWILQLDADEALSKELIMEIKETITDYGLRIKNNYIAYWLPRKNFFLTSFLMKGGQYPDYTIRLYRNGAVKFPLKSVHENVEIVNPKSEIRNSKQNQNLNDKNSKGFENLNLKNSDLFRASKFELRNYVGYLHNPILHYADPDFSRYLMRWDRYATLEAEMLVKTRKQYNNSTIKQFLLFLDYFFIKPVWTFSSMYFRHLGFLDGFPGFVFALFSSIRFWVIYIKTQQIKS